MMRQQRGDIAIAVALMLTGLLAAMHEAQILHITSVASLWPVVLVGMGCEEIWKWKTGANN